MSDTHEHGPRRSAATTAPLSFAQERLWFIDAAAPGAPTYNVPLLCRWAESVDVPALRVALGAVVAKHEVLRTTYQVRDGKPVQVIGDSADVAVEIIDLSDVDNAEALARTQAATRAKVGFDLSADTPVRCTVWTGVPDGALMLLCLHHIAVDGWSLAPLFEDLDRAYAAAVAGQAPDLAEPPVQYADFAVWDREVFAAPGVADLVAERVAELGKVPGDLALAGRVSTAAGAVRRGGEFVLPLGEAVWSGVLDLAKSSRATPFVVAFAAYQTVLRRWTGRDDFLVGTVTANRPHSSVENLVGFFVNTVPLRCSPRAGQTFAELCKLSKVESFNSLTYQGIPFDQLLAAGGSADRTAMITVGFALQNMTPPDLGDRPRWTDQELLPTGTAKFDLMLLVEHSAAGPVCRVEFDADRYPAWVAERVAEDFRVLLAAAVADPHQPTHRLPCSGGLPGLPAAAVVGTDPSDDGAETVLDLIERRLAIADPEVTAVSAGGVGISWRDLDSRSWAVAERLRGSGRFVPVLAARGAALVVGWLGVLRAGAAYAPLSLDTPVDRLAHILAELDAETILVDAAGAAIAANLAVTALRIEDFAAAEAPARPARPAPDSPAVVIYTSGTTGRPKGVLVSHRGMLNTARWWAEDIDLGPADRLLCTWSTSFDGASHEVMRSLIAGSELVFADDVERRDPRALAELLGTVTVTSMTPSLLRAVLDAGESTTTLRVLYVGGEGLPTALARECQARWNVPMRNIYGPTEIACIATFAPVDLDDGQPPAIGLPLPGTHGYVLGEHLEELPVGVPGELYLGGTGVALGYLGQPDRTRAVFLPDPYVPGALMYRTGDRVVLRPDGLLECLGRVDDQVKILGNRIETGEVSKLLEDQQAVWAAAVSAEGDPLRLVAWIVLADPARLPTRDEVLTPLLGWLPAAVLPTDVYVVDDLPMTGNDKTDFVALGRRRELALPRGEREVELTGHERAAAEIFAATLSDVDAEELAPEANFFTYGGHSLLAVRMLADAEQVRGGAVPLREFLPDPTVRGLAALLAAPISTVVAANPVDAERHPASAVQQRFWFIDRVRELRSAYLAPCLVEFTGSVDADALASAVTTVLGRHPGLRSRFELDLKQRKVFYRTDGAAPAVARVDATAWSDDELADHLADLCWTPFDLAKEAPARAEILRRTDRTLLAITAHHIVTDGWSQQVILEQIAALYQSPDAVLTDSVHPAALPAPRLDDDRIARVVDALRGAPTDIDLPHDMPRQSVQPTYADTTTATLDPRTVAGVRAVAAELGATTFAATAALLGVALSRRGGQRDFLFAFPWAGRETPGSADAVGMFVNTLVVRVDLRDDPTWRDLLARVRDHAMATFRDADVPFDAVAAALHPDRDLSRPPLTPVYVNVVTATAPPSLGPDLPGRVLRPDPLHVKYEIELAVTDRGDELDLDLSYAVDLFDTSTAAELLAAVTRCAADLVGDPDCPVSKENPLRSAVPAHTSDDPADFIEPIRRIWAEVLDTVTVPSDRNFFELGGDSLLLIVLLERLNAMTGRDLEAADLFNNSTIEGQARLLAAPHDQRELAELGATSRSRLVGRARRGE